jgi:neutral ceramidase
VQFTRRQFVSVSPVGHDGCRTSWVLQGPWSRTVVTRLTLCALLGALVVVNAADDCRRAAVYAGSPPLPLSAGAYAQDISPPRFPISVNGNMSDFLATSVHDPIHARCLVLSTQGTSLAIVIVDSCMVPRDLIDSAKRRIAYRTGIPATHILIAATHAHSCPTVTGVFQSDPDADYQEFLADRIVDGVTQAWNQREPARIAWGSATNDSQLFNRRWRLKPAVMATNPLGGTDDRVRMNPGYSSPDVTGPVGPIDPEVSIVSVQSQAGRPIAVLANYSLHYVGGVPAISADYFGEFAVRLSRLIRAGTHSAAAAKSASAADGTNTALQDEPNEPAFVAMMSNGTSADVNNVNFSLKSGPPRQPFEQISIVAESVAQTAYQAYQQLEYVDQIVLDAATAEVGFGVRRPNPDELARAERLLAEQPAGSLKGIDAIYAREAKLLADYPEQQPVVLQALRIGELAIVSSPCETFTETGLAIKAASPFGDTFVIELANGYSGYLPTPQQHRWGGYETWRARSSFTAVDAEPLYRVTIWSLLKQLAARR